MPPPKVSCCLACRKNWRDLHSRYVEAVNQYGPNYPKVLRLGQEIAEAESAVAGERQNFR